MEEQRQKGVNTIIVVVLFLVCFFFLCHCSIDLRDDEEFEPPRSDAIPALRLARVENVNESARNQLEILRQQSQRSCQHNFVIPDSQNSDDLPPTYEECMTYS